MRKLFALLLIVSMPVAGFAQSLAPAISPPASPLFLDQILGVHGAPFAAPGAHEVPLWSTSDGRILAAVAFDSGSYPTLPQSPRIGAATEWRLVDVTNLFSGGLLMRLGDNAFGHVDLARSSLLPFTSASIGLCGGPESSAYCGTPQTLAHSASLRVGATWLANAYLDLDLSYGLSWLRHDSSSLPLERQSTAYATLPGLSDTALPTLIIPGAELANVQNSSISALGRLHLSGTQAFDLGASLSRIQLSVPGAAPLTSLNQAAVSLGVEYGSFSGMLTGRMLGPSEPYAASATNPRWTGLDVGISWRTPWRGMFSVGAQNLWSSGSVPTLSPPAAREIDPNQARVPYVQYHQDL